ncbi:hypothetical protein EDB19DRAFT_1831025 [Suillus lakei]|nr:hypothetical protein EDB19DRAFT_1831025 [Suillus lakei]
MSHTPHSKDYPQQNGGYMCPKGSLITKGYGHTQLHDWRCHSKQLTAIPPHLKVQFWLQSNYDAWLNSATVLCIKQGTAPYLEEEDGTCVTNATLKSIHHRCCAAWAKLVVKKLALPTWTRLCASGQTLMQSVMEMEFPKHHLDQDGSWKNPDKTAAKHKAMGDNNNNSMHSDTKPNQAPVFKSKGKKHECIDDSLDSELTDKCQKVSSPINISNLDVSHNCNLNLLGSLGNSSGNQNEPDLPLPALPPSSPSPHGVLLPGIPLNNSNKENIVVILKNPL